MTKKNYLSAFLVFFALQLFAQAPQGINYQAVVRGANGQPLTAGTTVSMRFTIHNGSVGGTSVFEEIDTPITNQFGLVTVVIGNAASLSVVNWGNGEKFLQVEMDPNGGSNFIDMGTTKMESVPYALFAGNAANGVTGSTGVTGLNGANGINGVTGATGATGQNGTNGNNGVAGATGSQGITGATGAQGLQGIQGITGSNGVTGVTGLNGTNGINGATGAIGATGQNGTNGSNGVTGATGPSGQDGTNGNNGATGATGITGATGNDGTNGSNGVTGATGPSGQDGTNGSNGATGATGITGATGNDGTNGSNGVTGATGPSGQDGTNGSNGATGATGITGATGNDGTNGSNGVTGATGPSGQDGTNGSNGATGATGITGATGNDGTNGSNGVTGATGPSGQDGTNGSNGATGATGNDGATGSNGVAGATGASGQDGTNGSNGATGATGITGATGNDGTNGSNGVTGATGPSGQDGTNGSNGATGATGITGATGNDGTNGSNGVTGATGPSGQDGTNGSNGATGATGITGATGNDGTNGSNGVTGATGPSGQDGANGSNGATGATGITGATGNDGTNGSNGVTGATGPSGQDGANGSNGATGATGADAQTLSLSNDSLYISGGNSVNLANLADTMSLIASTNRATRIETQQSNDSAIYFTLGGIGYYKMNKGTIEFNNTGGSIYIGQGSGSSDNYTQTGYNVGVGPNTLQSASPANGSIDNVAIGDAAMQNSATPAYNVAIGNNALKALNDYYAYGNVAIGYSAGFQNTSGSNNTFLGFRAGQDNITGSGNVFIGGTAGYNETGSNKLYIANSSTTTPLIYGDFSRNHVTINDSLTSRYFQITNGADSGYVLQSDANGNATWANANNVFNNYWTYSGGYLYTNTNLNGSFVGIGTNTPASLLANTANNILGDDQQGISNNGFLWTDTATGYVAAIYNGGTVPSANGLLVNIPANSSGSRILDLTTGGSGSTPGTPAMVVQGNGRVGMGTSSPASQLANTANSVLGDDNQGTTSNGFTWTDTAIGYIAAVYNGSNSFSADGLLVNISSTTNYSRILDLTTGGNGNSKGTVAMVVEGSGMVGIGTGSPASQLANTVISVLGDDNQGTTNNGFTWTDTATGYIAAVYNGGNYNGADGLLVNISSTSASNRILDLTTGGNEVTGGTVAMVVEGNGMVGIGTGSPANTLTVAGTTQTTNFQMTNGATSGYVLKSDASGNASWISPSSLADTMSLIASSNRATRIETQKTNDSTIYFTLGGTNYFEMKKATLEVNNAGYSVYLGNSAGINDDYNSRYNTGIGNTALEKATTGANNVALGASALQNNSSGSYNTALGASALLANTTGVANTATGQQALRYDSTGSYNVAMGTSAGGYVTGSNNVLIGYGVGYVNASENTMIGSQAGWNNSGSGNLFLGFSSGYNETGNNKLYISNDSTSTPLIYGDFSRNHVTINDSLTSQYFQMTNGAASGYVLKSDGSGNASWISPSALADTMSLIASSNRATRIETQKSNDSTIYFTLGGTNYFEMKRATIEVNNSGSSVYLGSSAGLTDNYSGLHNTGIGTYALQKVTKQDNVALGYESLQNNTTGNSNTGAGSYTLQYNTTGNDNVAVGAVALLNGNGSQNSALGQQAGFGSTGNDNVFVGFATGNVNGSENTMVGSQSGFNNSGEGNVFLGFSAGYYEAGNNKLYIANDSTSTPLIYGDFSRNHVTVNDSLTSQYFQMTNGAYSGYVLQSDASGNASWVSPTSLTTTVAGTGLVYSNDTLNSNWTTSGNNIYNNNTGNVGIGTSSPTSTLDIYNSSGTASARVKSGTGNAYINIAAGVSGSEASVAAFTGTTQRWSFGKSNGVETGSNAGSDFFVNRYSDAGSYMGQPFVIQRSTGNVGIGTGSPDTTLHVVGKFRYQDGSQTNGYVLQSDANGNATWVAPASTSVPAGKGLSYSNDTLNSVWTASGSNIYNNNSGSVGIGTSSPAELLDVSGGNLLVTGTFGSGNTIAETGAGARMFFTPQTASFRAGYVSGTQWDSTNIGAYSFAAGQNTTASGQSSFAFGQGSSAGGKNSIAGGYSNSASAQGAVALGESNSATNLDAVALGINNTAGNTSAFAAGDGNTASGGSSVALGIGNTASGTYSIAMGNTNKAQQAGAVAIGLGNTAGNLFTIAMGQGNTASAQNAVAMGYENYSSGNASTAMGASDSAEANYSFVAGQGNKATGNYSFAAGSLNTATNVGAFALGESNKATSQDAVAIGSGNTASNMQAFAAGEDNTSSGDQSFAAGEGNTSGGNQAFAMGAGNTASGNVSMAFGTGNRAQAQASVAAGFGNIASNMSAVAIGLNNISSGSAAVTIGANDSATGSYSFAANYSTTAPSYAEAVFGQYNTDYTPNSTTSWNTADRLFTVGNGTGSGSSASNALTILKSGNTGLGTSSPVSTLDINGSLGAKFQSGLTAGITNPDATGLYWRYNTGTGTITLPAASSCPNRTYVIINQTGTTRTISSYSDLTTTPQTTIGSSVALWIVSDGTNWYQVK